MELELLALKDSSWFWQQLPALNKADDKGWPVWGYELPGGKRRYLVSPYHVFWRNYNGAYAEDRFFYEVIRDGPCRLYFDIEFPIDLNRGLLAHEDEILETFVAYVNHCISLAFGKDCNVASKRYKMSYLYI